MTHDVAVHVWRLGRRSSVGGLSSNDTARHADQQEPQPQPSVNPKSRALVERSDLPTDFLARQVSAAAAAQCRRRSSISTTITQSMHAYNPLLSPTPCTACAQLLAND